jgi:superfamily II DNA/RNA helicase
VKRAGSGKTLAFLLPLVIFAKRAAMRGQQGLKALVISPTRELAEQTARVLLLLVKELHLSCCLLSTAANAAGTNFSKVASHLSLWVSYP